MAMATESLAERRKERRKGRSVEAMETKMGMAVKIRLIECRRDTGEVLTSKLCPQQGKPYTKRSDGSCLPAPEHGGVTVTATAWPMGDPFALVSRRELTKACMNVARSGGRVVIIRRAGSRTCERAMCCREWPAVPLVVAGPEESACLSPTPSSAGPSSSFKLGPGLWPPRHPVMHVRRQVAVRLAVWTGGMVI